jgi:hypothetical protein
VDFLNGVSSIIGRYQDRLRTIGPLSLADKFNLLEVVFSYYLTGIANIRAANQTNDYEFQLLLVDYDSDGTPQIGRLVLGIVFEQGRTFELLPGNATSSESDTVKWFASMVQMTLRQKLSAVRGLGGPEDRTDRD